MKYSVSLVKAFGVPGPSENSPPTDSKVIIREIELPFLPYPEMDYVYRAEEYIFEETIDSVAYIESEDRFEARIGYTEFKTVEEMMEAFEVYLSSGWREVLPPEDDKEEEDQVFDNDLIPKDLDDHLRELQ